MPDELVNENEIFNDLVKKTSSSCFQVVTQDHKLLTLLLPKVGINMFVLFVAVRIADVVMQHLIKEKEVGLVQIYRERLNAVLAKR